MLKIDRFFCVSGDCDEKQLFRFRGTEARRSTVSSVMVFRAKISLRETRKPFDFSFLSFSAQFGQHEKQNKSRGKGWRFSKKFSVLRLRQKTFLKILPDPLLVLNNTGLRFVFFADPHILLFQKSLDFLNLIKR
jgi:hypothetical protein